MNKPSAQVLFLLLMQWSLIGEVLERGRKHTDEAAVFEASENKDVCPGWWLTGLSADL